MSVDRNELHELVDALPEDQLLAAAEILRWRAEPRTARTTEPFAWIGAGETKDGSSDVSANTDKYLAGFGRDSL